MAGLPAAAEFVALCKKVQQAYAEIQPRDSAIPVRVQDWIKVVENKISAETGQPFKVDIRFVDKQGELVKGILCRYSNGISRIIVSHGETYIFSR